MSKVIKLSATRINTFLQCKKKYWFGYVDKLPKLSSPAFKLGLACHEALEFGGNIWKDENLEEFSKAHKKAIIDEYKRKSVYFGIEDFAEHKEGIEIVKARINDFRLGRRIVGLEDKFGFPGSPDFITDEGVPMIGAIDKTVEIDDDTLLIVDYKTSKMVPDNDKLKNDIQLSVYHMIAEKLYPGYKRIILSLDMLRKNELVYTYRTQEDMAELREYLKLVYDAMCGLEEKDAKASLNTFCSWCDYKDNCEEYKEAYEKSKYNFSSVTGMRDDELMLEWERVRDVKKVLEERERQLSLVMMEKIKHGGETISTDEKEMTVRQMARKTYDSGAIKDILSYDDYASVTTVNTNKLNKLCEKNPALKAKVSETMTVNFTSPFLATKKVKAKKGK